MLIALFFASMAMSFGIAPLGFLLIPVFSFPISGHVGAAIFILLKSNKQKIPKEVVYLLGLHSILTSMYAVPPQFIPGGAGFLLTIPLFLIATTSTAIILREIAVRIERSESGELVYWRLIVMSLAIFPYVLIVLGNLIFDSESIPMLS